MYFAVNLWLFPTLQATQYKLHSQTVGAPQFKAASVQNPRLSYGGLVQMAERYREGRFDCWCVSVPQHGGGHRAHAHLKREQHGLLAGASSGGFLWEDFREPDCSCTLCGIALSSSYGDQTQCHFQCRWWTGLELASMHRKDGHTVKNPWFIIVFIYSIFIIYSFFLFL